MRPWILPVPEYYARMKAAGQAVDSDAAVLRYASGRAIERELTEHDPETEYELAFLHVIRFLSQEDQLNGTAQPTP